MNNKKMVIAQYEAVRRLGQTNMFNKTMVQRIAYENRFYALVNAIEENYGFILENYSELMKLIEETDIPDCSPLKTSYSI